MTFKEILPNTLSSLRILSVPFLLYFSYQERHNLFLALLVFALATDALDGFLARALKVTSKLGAKLDSFGDMGVYLAVPFCAYWLYPEIVREELGFLLIVVLSYTVPIIASLLKFRRVASYHTWSAKLAGVVMSIAILLVFLTETVWLSRIAAFFQAVVAIECVLITLRLRAPQADVKSVFHVYNET